MVFPRNGRRLELPSRTTLEKQAAFEAVYGYLRARPEEGLQAVADLAIQAGVSPSRLTTECCLCWDEVQTLAREPEVSIGAHTLSHPILAKCQATSAAHQIAESKSLLERRLGRPVGHLAYPFGDPSAVGVRECQLARQAGYATAVISRPGHVFPAHLAHLHALPRVSINGSFQDTKTLRALLSGVPFWIRNRGRIVTIDR